MLFPRYRDRAAGGRGDRGCGRKRGWDHILSQTSDISPTARGRDGGRGLKSRIRFFWNAASLSKCRVDGRGLRFWTFLLASGRILTKGRRSKGEDRDLKGGEGGGKRETVVNLRLIAIRSGAVNGRGGPVIS